jgi:hypothetical protein
MNSTTLYGDLRHTCVGCATHADDGGGCCAVEGSRGTLGGAWLLALSVLVVRRHSRARQQNANVDIVELPTRP